MNESRTYLYRLSGNRGAIVGGGSLFDAEPAREVSAKPVKPLLSEAEKTVTMVARNGHVEEALQKEIELKSPYSS